MALALALDMENCMCSASIVLFAEEMTNRPVAHGKPAENRAAGPITET